MSLSVSLLLAAALTSEACSVYDPDASGPVATESGSATGARTSGADADGDTVGGGSVGGPTGGGAPGGETTDTPTTNAGEVTGATDDGATTAADGDWISCGSMEVCLEWDLSSAGPDVDAAAAVEAAQVSCDAYVEVGSQTTGRCPTGGAVGSCSGAQGLVMAAGLPANVVHYSCAMLLTFDSHMELCGALSGTWTPLGAGCDSETDCQMPCSGDENCDQFVCVDVGDGPVCVPEDCRLCNQGGGTCFVDRLCGVLCQE